MSLFASSAGLLVLLALAVNPQHLAYGALPTGFVGHWQGYPQTAVVGPMAHPFNFSIEALQHSDGNAWLMSDHFLSYLLRDSVQYFWVESDATGTNGTLTYCGVVRNFFNTPYVSGDIEAQFLLTVQSETTMQWSMNASQFGAAATWTLTLLNGGQQLQSYLELPPPVTHLLVVFNRSSASATTAMDAEEVGMDDAHGRAAVRSGTIPFHACNFSGVVAQRHRLHQQTQPLPLGHPPVQGGGSGGGSSLCPYGYGSQRAAMERQKHPSVPSSPSQASSASAFIRELLGSTTSAAFPLQYCYVINDALGVTLRWTWNTTTESVNVLFSANVSKVTSQANGGSAGTSGYYLAIGILPSWPGMNGMDVVLGHGKVAASSSSTQGGVATGCVLSLYAQDFVGRPVAGNQTLTDTTYATTSDGTVYVGFTRPWNTGHHNLKEPYAGHLFPTVSWAIGESDDASCSASSFYYHGSTRGTYGMSWENPTQALPDAMRCPE